MKQIERLIEDVRSDSVTDPRGAVFDVEVERRDGRIVLHGETTDPAAVDRLVERAADRIDGAELVDTVVRLPDPSLGDERHALVRAGLAPVHKRPAIAATQVSQYVLGQRVDVLSRREAWCRVRGEDGYIGWVHHGYLEFGDAEWATSWERGGDRVVVLGGVLLDDDDEAIARLPWGARLFRDTPKRFRLPDGRSGRLAGGEAVGRHRLRDRFPPRGESVARTARLWLGAPYLWGGVTTAGVDCSGFVQAVLWVHGVGLPRDSDQQARIGDEVDVDGFDALQPGDLLYFAERPGRITHVAIALGAGRIIHAALFNGGVAVNDLTGDSELESRLRRIFVHARRVLPD